MQGVRLEAQGGGVGPGPEVKEAPLGHRDRDRRKPAESEPCREARPQGLLRQ